jgi:hypothetical protein
MARDKKASPASEASQDSRTSHSLVSDSAVSAYNYTTPFGVPSTLKRTLMFALATIFGRSPALAAALARLVVWCCAGSGGRDDA